MIAPRFRISRCAHGWLVVDTLSLSAPSFVEILGLVEGREDAAETDGGERGAVPRSLLVLFLRPDEANQPLAVDHTLIAETLSRSLQIGARAVTILLRQVEQSELKAGLQDVYPTGRAALREPFWLTSHLHVVPAPRRAELAGLMADSYRAGAGAARGNPRLPSSEARA